MSSERHAPKHPGSEPAAATAREPQRRLGRRRLIGLGAGLAGTLLGARALLPWALRAPTVRPLAELSAEARALAAKSFDGVDAAQLLDCHLHVVGIGDGATGCEVNPEMRSHLSPIRRIQYEAYLAASGVEENGRVDADYLARVQEQLSAFPDGARFALLAFDWFYDHDGVRRPDKSSFFVPNDYVARLCQQSPRYSFFASIHPYRQDALAELERVVAQGATGIKWLPNAMNIDPADPRCSPFYDKLRELGVVLLSHAGHELAVHGDDAQALGNPLRLRTPLDHGVTVVIAHAASLGYSLDLDDPARRSVPSFELFLRLMNEPRYHGLLYGELSATTLSNRDPSMLRRLLEATQLHERLLNGSDYPVIAVSPLVRMSRFVNAGLLDQTELPALRELFAASPVLWDFVFKRRLRIQTERGPLHFAPRVFEGGRLLRQ